MTASAIDLLLIAGRAVFLIFSFALAAVTFIRWRRSSLAQTEQVLAQHQTVLQRLAELEARVDATRVAISKLGERIERPQPLPSTVNSAAPGYQIAIRLAKGGASREELISGCGLSIHEAELVHRLHAPQTPASAKKSGSEHPRAA
jgi:alkylation response protein AidB-like acyl-CoA dehydrogenase